MDVYCDSLATRPNIDFGYQQGELHAKICVQDSIVRPTVQGGSSKEKRKGECRVAEGCLNVMGGESLSTRESSTKESATESECSDVQM